MIWMKMINVGGFWRKESFKTRVEQMLLVRSLS
jgi:hypothetical protein